jgi:exosortase A
MIASNLKQTNPLTLIYIKVGIIAGCLTLIYFPIIKGLVHDWINLPDFSHGFLIPLLFLYFLYKRRTQLITLKPSANWAGLSLIFIGVMLLLVGNLSSEYFTMRFSILIVIGGVILFLLGKAFFKILLFPIIFLIFMIPLPSILIDQITFPLQIIASKVAAQTLYFIGVPVLREGNIILLANTSLEVTEACSGIRSFISLLAVSVVFSYVTQKRTWNRVLIILSTFPIAVIANAARVSGTGVLAYQYGDSVAQGFFHGFSGWILFIVAFLCLFGIGSVISRIK